MEKLTVKNLGPIKDFTMETNRLTVLIGPQASGKSLLAQMLYFINEFDYMLAEKFPVSRAEAKWFQNVLETMLTELRATAFSYYFKNGGFIEYADTIKRCQLTRVNGSLECGSLCERMEVLLDSWGQNKKELANFSDSRQVFIPTERSVFTRLSIASPALLYSEKMPYVLRKFAEKVDWCGKVSCMMNVYDDLYPGALLSERAKEIRIAYDVLTLLERKSLCGEILYDGVDTTSRNWFVKVDSGDSSLKIPVVASSSGQMETWPFFVLAKLYGTQKECHTFYFEEPETHLHPSAQVEVVKTIAYLISRGHRFVITTHSPFILYVINNLIQAHIAYEGSPPEGEFSINPDHVAAYCLGDNPRSIVKPDTKLLELREIDSVFDKLNVDFERYMDMEFAREGK